MSWSVADIPDQDGRTAVVTGGNGGLGLETSKALAWAGAHVVIAARNREKAERAAEEIRSGTPRGRVETVPLDLASLESVGDAADRILEAHPSIDLLVNNAGVMGIPEQRTVDGFEMQLGVDHLGHFALTAHLMPALLRAGAARIVTVTSTARHFGRAIDPANPHLEGRYGPWRSYGQAKLANYHFGLGLHRILDDAGVQAASLVAHPGLTNTDLQRVSVKESGGGRSQRFFRSLAVGAGMSPARGALSQLRAATDPDAAGGELYGPRYGGIGPPVRLPVIRRIGMTKAIARLWEVSERETGVKLEVPGTRRPSLAEAG